ncbi:peptidyl-prolyl cis-trans isomerase [Cellvibrio japonicus]|nr:peptidyl-prolyl cis-trans isomerase [Cellvibrio japonicus]QEI12899.1 hypothetical protein FY117_12150 [Cellvibrio japonicus]QEI16473.1 hypothetical protein FY116_12155 [Cellvibrio japonicus]QEI20051.1 hypothetical protein FY115_12150 [Cellvibrio japonicus]
MFSKKLTLLVTLFLCLPACDRADKSTEVSASVVATVNGEAITREQVDYMLERMLGAQPLVPITRELRGKVLDSLIASKAMTLQVKSSMSEEDSQRVQRAVQAYEEELYVKEYLARYATPEPVTVEMVSAYYDAHPNEFGGGVLKHFQLLLLRDSGDDKKRDAFLSAVESLKASTDWKARAGEWSRQLPIEYQEGKYAPGLLDERLGKVIDQLGKQATSDLIYVDKAIYLVRVSDVVQTAPKPIAEVSADIRKKLAAQQLRAAVKKATDDVVKTMDVKVINP